MRNTWAKTALFLAASSLPALGFSDTVMVVHVDLSGGTPSREAPPVGDYRFTFGKTQATVTSPNGKTFVLNFDQKTFVSINPATKSFYQTEIADVLSVGNLAPASLGGNGRVAGRIAFSPNTVGSETVFSRPVNVYRMDLEASLSLSNGNPGGFSGSLSTRGGGGFSLPTSSERSSVTPRRTVQGSLSLGSTPAGLDQDQMNTAIECVLLWGAPELKELANRIHRTNLVIYGGEFEIATHSQREAVGLPTPTVSIKITSLGLGTLDPGSLNVPSDYKRVSPPGSLFGN